MMKRRFSVYVFLSMLLLLAACSSPVDEQLSEDPAELEPAETSTPVIQPTWTPTEEVAAPTKLATTTRPATATPTETPGEMATTEPTQMPTATATITPPPLAVPTLAPVASANDMRIAGWSPDSCCLAYWISDQDDQGPQPPGMSPGGTLAFWAATSGDTCVASQFHTGAGEEADVNWHEDGSLTIVMPDGVYQGRPCQTEPFTLLANYEPAQADQADKRLSIDGRFQIITSQTGNEEGILSYQTRLVETGNGVDRITASWQIDQRLGDYTDWLGGAWVSPSQFLIYETLKQGPLLLDAEQGLISVLPDLLDQDAIPFILDETGVSMKAHPIPGPDTNTFHLVVSGVGTEGNFPPARLYHSENDQVEILPYSRLYRQPFSDNGQWLFLNSSPDVDGYETVEIWMRRVEDMEGEWSLLASDVDGALWSPDETEMVNVEGDTTVIWRTFPEDEELGRWDTDPYWSFPISFSPDGRYVALGGYSPGQPGQVLFVLARPES
jgi:hypothetical protein